MPPALGAFAHPQAHQPLAVDRKFALLSARCAGWLSGVCLPTYRIVAALTNACLPHSHTNPALPCCMQAPIDFNQYLGIQRAGIACLQLPQERVREYAAVWRQRAAALVPVLRRFGWMLPEPKACKDFRSAVCCIVCKYMGAVLLPVW